MVRRLGVVLLAGAALALAGTGPLAAGTDTEAGPARPAVTAADPGAGSLLGLVTDPSGAGVPNARVD
ncbi:MAG TPA: L,D-transpeptidase, partial [Vicinamibacteria bacterium]|nr:L,D-transpeptidase [Vicinamibacteria bacterium]